MIAIIDYDAGNVGSVMKAFRSIGASALLTGSASDIEKAEAVVLPGVGAFGDVVKNLRDRGLEQPIKSYISSGRPFLGICVGLQMLFDDSEESPEAKGLGVLKGRVLRLPSDAGLKVPHIGWNSIDFDPCCPLFAGLPNELYVYFVHSYYLRADDDGIVCATTEYGAHIHAAVQSGLCFATQFHPEKSGDAGLAILKNFCSLF